MLVSRFVITLIADQNLEPNYGYLIPIPIHSESINSGKFCTTGTTRVLGTNLLGFGKSETS